MVNHKSQPLPNTEPPDKKLLDLSQRDSPYYTVQIPLKNVIRYDGYMLIINDIVLRCNDIVSTTYEFISLYCIYNKDNKLPQPLIDDKFILDCFRVLGIRDNRGSKCEEREIRQTLETFYEQHFKPIYNHKKFNLKNLSFIMPYLAKTMTTCISNNLKEHFYTRLIRFLNILIAIYCRNNDIDKDDADNKKVFYTFKKAVAEFEFDKIPEEFREIFNQHRHKLLPQDIPTIEDILSKKKKKTKSNNEVKKEETDKKSSKKKKVNEPKVETEKKQKSVAFDAKVNPYDYINHTMYMNEYFESLNDNIYKQLQNETLSKEEKDELNCQILKLFQPLSLRKSFIPKMITLDTACLVNIFMADNEEYKDSTQDEEDELQMMMEQDIHVKSKSELNQERELTDMLFEDLDIKTDDEIKLLKKNKRKQRVKLSSEEKVELERSKEEKKMQREEHKKVKEEAKQMKLELKQQNKELKLMMKEDKKVVREPSIGTKGYYLKYIEKTKREIWNKYFKFGNKVFHTSEKSNYEFNFTCSTDGVCMNLLFVRKDIADKGYGEKVIIETTPQPSIDELDDQLLENLKEKKIVCSDKGKFYIIYCVDDEGNEVRYSAKQRDIESLNKRNKRIRHQERIKNKIIQEESKLSQFNSKTVNLEKFKQYIKAKYEVGKKVKKFYQQQLFRKLNLRSKIYRHKSEDKFINQLIKSFGNPSDIVFVIGNWGSGKQTMMKGSEATMGSGINRLIAKFFPVLQVDEFNTSKKCCNCGCDVENLYMPKMNHKSKKIENTKIHRLMRCKNCMSIAQNKLKSKLDNLKLKTTSSDSKKQVAFNGGYLTRDKNSCINMMNIVKSYIYTKTRPEEYQRTKKVDIPVKLTKRSEKNDSSTSSNGQTL